MFDINLHWAALGALPGTMILLAATPAGTDLAPVSGKFAMKYSQQHALPVADAAGPVLLANEAKGTNSNTGRTEYMDGAAVTILETADLSQGNGPHQGYVTLAKDGETTRNRFSGHVTTKLTAEKQPITTFEGTWTKIGGSGRYDGVSGKGRYKGRMLSPTDYVIEWDGELNLRDKTAGR